MYQNPLAGLEYYSVNIIPSSLPIISEETLVSSPQLIKVVSDSLKSVGLEKPVSTETIAQAYSQKGGLFLDYLTENLSLQQNLSLSPALKENARKALRTVLEAVIGKANEELIKNGQNPVKVPTNTDTPTTPTTETTDYKPYLIGGSIILAVIAVLVWIKKR
ncbi:hypothetical protein VB776_16315 [Arcicella sp. DC2W]|uniref:Uncharacterized protein n=1 Tax=Arcicella gelida TaxID=2984195 RepID=A0ABU5S7P1_9BACT|nr:hypothetical protein [Arcicella sp. DC2W]MEA5404498.1 hypothetical protein [Arcicella sp. DC2W]